MRRLIGVPLLALVVALAAAGCSSTISESAPAATVTVATPTASASGHATPSPTDDCKFTDPDTKQVKEGTCGKVLNVEYRSSDLLSGSSWQMRVQDKDGPLRVIKASWGADDIHDRVHAGDEVAYLAEDGSTISPWGIRVIRAAGSA
jgi:hypothetical protein